MLLCIFFFRSHVNVQLLTTHFYIDVAVTKNKRLKHLYLALISVGPSHVL